MPRISIIIPAYNIEKYIRKCIDSILQQTYTDYEILIVNDGSTDQTGLICDEYKRLHPKIQVWHQENQGQSAARNLAINMACGEFITFIDGDDWISDDYLEQMIAAVDKTGADVSVCGLKYFNDGEMPTFTPKKMYQYNVVPGRGVCICYYKMEPIITVGPLGKLFRAELLKDIRFPVGKIYEDQGTIPRLLYLADKVVFITESELYAYCVRIGSTSHSNFSARRFEDVWNVNLCYHFFCNMDDLELMQYSHRFEIVLQAKYIVQAYHYHATEQIPNQYRMKLITALKIIRAETKYDTFSWYLSLVYPKLVRPYSYIHKLETMLSKKE